MIKNKLVRDLMIKIILNDGYVPKFKIIKGNQLKIALKNKLVEEANEVLISKTKQNLLEELADTYQALIDLTKESGFSMKDLTTEVNRKFKDRGGFRKGVFLINVTTRN
jgi:predicted house-cleaning noncanonical NTP pyrophosphatase (MazG superfamily)